MLAHTLVVLDRMVSPAREREEKEERM